MPATRKRAQTWRSDAQSNVTATPRGRGTPSRGGGTRRRAKQTRLDPEVPDQQQAGTSAPTTSTSTSTITSPSTTPLLPAPVTQTQCVSQSGELSIVTIDPTRIAPDQGVSTPVVTGAASGPIITGSINSTNVLPPPSLHPIGMIPQGDQLIGLHVPTTLREKICNHKYVNLSLLLKGDGELQDLCAATPLVVNAEGQLEARPKQYKGAVKNVDQWTDAFIIFSAIYLGNHPQKSVSILKYMQTIRCAASRHGDFGWRSYDEQFRMRMSVNPSISWASVDYELWLIYMTPGKHTTTTSYVKFQDQSPSKGVCFDFNGQGCSRSKCRFGHQCSNCGGNHAINQCTSKQQFSDNKPEEETTL